MVKTLLLSIIAVLVILKIVLAEKENWQSFKAKFGKKYNVNEEQTRYEIFMENLQIIESHNKKYEQGLVLYKKGINKFTDMTKGEFATFLGFHRTITNSTTKVIFKNPAKAYVPDQMNWVDVGAVTGVKDQGFCGSCWSFSATGSIEGQYYIKYKKLVSLSEQNLVDCSLSYGDYGCFGGEMDNAFQYARDNGLMSETDYPYIGFDLKGCRFDTKKVVVKVTSFVNIRVGSEDDLKAAVATVGPVSVAVDASEFHMYAGGILDDLNCGNNAFELDHGILTVGYGTADGTDYWLVKNSWGEDWGENGYIRMSRNKNNQCGIASSASYPVL